jgi:glutamate/tyrosine decarboxylase-like PLP-dependent enzyme
MQDNQSPFTQVLGQALEASLKHLTTLDTQPVGAQATVAELRAQLKKPLNNESLPAEQVVAELVRDVQGGLHGTAGGRFFGWVIGGSVPAALAADWLTSTWDQNAGLFAVAPAAAMAEEIAGEWLKEIFGLPQDASFAFVTGCQMAHATCLNAARHAVYEHVGWDVETQGLAGAPRVRILANAHRHSSVDRAVRLLGMGTAQIEPVATDEFGRTKVEALQAALKVHRERPTILCLQAGEINTGVSDDFVKLIPIAKEAGAWVHVDGAFGLWAAASEKLRGQVAGIQAADSWATDGHKWLNVPYDSGFAFVRDREAHRGGFAQKAAYLTHQQEARDPMDWTPEFSRRARGFPTYAAIRQMGRAGIADLIERCCRHAHAIAVGIGKLDGAKVVYEPTLNQGLIQFLDPKIGATEADHSRRTDAVIAKIAKSGEAFFTGSEWNGSRVMRVSVCSWQTTDADVVRVVRAVETALNESLTGEL